LPEKQTEKNRIGGGAKKKSVFKIRVAPVVVKKMGCRRVYAIAAKSGVGGKKRTKYVGWRPQGTPRLTTAEKGTERNRTLVGQRATKISPKK